MKRLILLSLLAFVNQAYAWQFECSVYRVGKEYLNLQLPATIGPAEGTPGGSSFRSTQLNSLVLDAAGYRIDLLLTGDSKNQLGTRQLKVVVTDATGEAQSATGMANGIVTYESSRIHVACFPEGWFKSTP